jgi:hypothetical protein
MPVIFISGDISVLPDTLVDLYYLYHKPVQEFMVPQNAH